MVRMLVDTSVWLDVGADPKDVPLIGVVEELIQRNLLSLVVPKIVLDEFLAGRARVAAECGKRLSAQFRIVKDTLKQAGCDESVIRKLDNVEQSAPARGRVAAQGLARIERLLRRGPIVEASEASLHAAIRRALDEVAPFRQKKNEMADAVIIEIYREAVDTSADEGARWAFVTHNKSDFSAKGDSERKPHPDYACFRPEKSEYFISLLDALRFVEPSLVTKLLTTWEDLQPTLGDLISRYLEEADATEPLGLSHRYALVALMTTPISSKVAAKLQAKDFVDHCSLRQDQGVGPTTLRQDVTYFRGVLAKAETEWLVLGVSTDAVDEAARQLEKMRVVSHSTERYRRPTAAEIEELINFFRNQDEDRRARVKMVDVMEFALATGRSISEIYSLRGAEFDAKKKTCVVHLKPSRRFGKRRAKTVPLLDEAVDIIKRLPRVGDRIFPGGHKTVSARFTRAKKKLHIKNLRFHDLRREAVNKMLDAGLGLDRISELTGLSINRLHRGYRRPEE